MPATCPRCGADAPADARFCQSCGAIMGDGDAALVGKIVANKYSVLDEIGEGSMGRIYLAEHVGLEKRVALKVLHREVVLGPEGLQRFRREGVAAGKLSHPNAIEVFDFDVTESGDAFLAMEYVEGRDLRKVLEEDGAFALEKARDVILQALDALEAAHGHGIVHRDLKPENIMLVEGPDGPRVKVLDFGLSKLVDTRMEASLATVPGRVIGTPFYMAPEQSSGEEADSRTDLYAMGVIFYELLAGQRPFTGRNLTELLYAQATQDVPSVRELPEVEGLPGWVDAFVTRALERDREDRYQSAAEMAADLRAGAVEKGASPARPRGTNLRAAGASAPESRSRAPWVLPAILGAAALAIVATAVALRGDEAGNGPARTGDRSAEVVRVRERSPALRSESDETYLRLLDSARAQIREGRPAAAEGTVSSLMALSQVDAEAFVVRARLRLAQEGFDLAAADLREARERGARYVEAWELSGWVELERDRPEEARPYFERALELEEGAADALAGLARLALAAGDEGRAKELIDRALASERTNWRAQLARAELSLRGGDAAGAIDGFVEAKRLHGSSPDVLVGLARAYLADGRLDDAIEQYREALAVVPGDPEMVRGLAAVQLDRERFRDVVNLLQPIVSRGGAAPEESALLGLAYNGLGNDPASAVEYLQTAVDGGIVDPRPKALLASLLLETNKPEAARRAAESALEDDPAFAEAHLYRGVALFRLERYEDAEEALRTAVGCDADCAAAWFLLGLLGMDYLEDGSRAVEDLEGYLEAGGDDPRVEGWLDQLMAR